MRALVSERAARRRAGNGVGASGLRKAVSSASAGVAQMRSGEPEVFVVVDNVGMVRQAARELEPDSQRSPLPVSIRECTWS